MHVEKFGLGMRLPLINGEPPEGSLDTLKSVLAKVNTKNLTLHAGTVEDMYVIVIMGGGLSQMRKLYAAISSCGKFTHLLAKELAYIGNNRISHLPELAEMPISAA